MCLISIQLVLVIVCLPQCNLGILMRLQPIVEAAGELALVGRRRVTLAE